MLIGGVGRSHALRGLVLACCLAVSTCGGPAAPSPPDPAVCTPAPGTVCFGRLNFVEYAAGDLPIVVSVPHGGALAPASIPTRTVGTTTTDSNTIDLGRAIVHYRGMIPSAFSIAAIFDRKAADLQEQAPDIIPVLSDDCIRGEVARLGIKIGIVAVPASAAQEVSDNLVSGGVLAILNYAPVVLRVPSNVTVREIDPISAMQSMTFYLPD